MTNGQSEGSLSECPATYSWSLLSKEHNELIKMLRYTQESLIHIPIDDLLTGPFSGLTTAQHDGV